MQPISLELDGRTGSGDGVGVPCCSSSNPIQQRERCRAAAAAHVHYIAAAYSSDGVFVRPEVEVSWRNGLWHSLFLLQSEDIHQRRLANQMIWRVVEREGHFWTSAVTSLLARFADRMEDRVRFALQARMREVIAAEVGQRFRGFNDNYPAMAALSLLVGAPLVGREDLTADGIRSLESGRDLLRRRGQLSEYNSPTYSPITLTCLAEIAELSPIAEARSIALELEALVWQDLAARFHPATSTLAGPYSRAYARDLCGTYNQSHAVLFQVLGDAVFINPTCSLPTAVSAENSTASSIEAAWAHTAWQMTPTYHPPAEAVELALRKPPGTIVRASAEQAAFPRTFWKSTLHPRTPTAEFPAGEMNTYTYLDREYAFGVSDRPFLDGYQHAAFHVTYKRPDRGGRPGMRTLFSRYHMVGDLLAGHNLLEEGRTLCAAHASTAMVLYRPKPQWGDPSPVTDATVHPVGSLKLSLFVPDIADEPEEIWIGGNRCPNWSGDAAAAAPVFLRDGLLFAAIHPLIGSDLGRRHTVRLEKVGRYGLISLFNYEGTPRTFSDLELLTCHNGFVIELASSDQWRGDFAAFRQRHASPRISDDWHAGDSSRRVQYDNGQVRLDMQISPLSDGIKYRAANGNLIETPRFDVGRADGAD